jgi:hypothetical protein
VPSWTANGVLIMARPTQEANFKFNKAEKLADQAGGFYIKAGGKEEMGNRYLSAAVRELADGMRHLSDGLRATYILLEEIKNGPRR